jgi:type II secretory pathway pseudopilin PulG
MSRRSGPATTRGFSALELLFAVALITIMGAISMVVAPAVLARAKSDSAAASLVAMMRTAREQAISQRRLVTVQFVEGNRVIVSRVDVPGPGTTRLLDARLEQNARFLRFSSTPDTPDLFGADSAVDFGTAALFCFTSEGTFVDQNGDELNGTVFIGLPEQPATAQAVTFFGPTAAVRAWRFDGARWVE